MNSLLCELVYNAYLSELYVVLLRIIRGKFQAVEEPNIPFKFWHRNCSTKSFAYCALDERRVNRVNFKSCELEYYRKNAVSIQTSKLNI